MTGQAPLIALLLCATLASTAQASFLEVKFHGFVSSSEDPNGEYFNAGVGQNTIVGQEVLGVSRVDLALSQYGYFDDYPWQGEYSTQDRALDRSFISTSFSIGGRSYVLLNEPISDEEVVLYNGPAVEGNDQINDYWSLRDEFHNPPDFTWALDLGFSDAGNHLLNSLDLNQEFAWYDPDLTDPHRLGIGSFSIEQNGFGGAVFVLNSFSVTMFDDPAQVPEPSMISLVLLGMLMFWRTERAS